MNMEVETVEHEEPQFDRLTEDRGIRKHVEAAFAAHKPTNPDVDLVNQNAKEAHDAIRRASFGGKDVKHFSDLHPNDRRHLQVRDAYTQGKFKAAAASPDKEIKTGPQQYMHDGPPGVWDSNAKSEWEKLSPAVRTSILREQNENLRLLEQATPMMKKYSELDRAIAPHREILPKEVSEPEAIGNMLQWARLIHPSNPDKATGMAMLMQQQGVTLQDVYNVLVQAQQGQQQQQQAQQPQQYDQSQQAYQSQQQQVAEIEATLKTFSQGRPYFDAVRVQMGKLMEAHQEDYKGLDDNAALDKAYREACTLAGYVTGKPTSTKQAAAISPNTRSPSQAPTSKAAKGSSIRQSIRAAIQESRGHI